VFEVRGKEDNMKFFVSFVMAALLSACQFVQERPSSTPTLKKVSVNGTTLTYLEQGTGPSVVFLHGAFSDHRIWETQREAVAKGYRFIALDLRYFGTAPWSDDGTHFRQATHVADVAAFIRELKVGPVHLVGRSYGATTSLAIAIQHPELVRSLFLNEPGLVSAVTNPADQKIAAEDRKCMATVGASAKAGNTAEATKLFFECVNGQPGEFDALPPDSRAMHLDNARTVPLQLNPASPIRMTCVQLGEIKVPVGITKGELTRPYYQVTVGAVHRCVPGSRLITVKGARHGAPAQQPAAFNEALLAFLARN
jgi:pimeloyl-ACP methyl ester carboxylesterase